ncbi:uncharacterized protein ACMZJ9_011193 [Mantella aurantiaca]
MKDQIIRILGRHLKKLKPDKLEIFQNKFCMMEPPRGKMKIEIKQLANKSAVEIAETIVESYTVQYGPSTVKNVLKEMGLNQSKLELENDLKAVKKKTQKKKGSADEVQEAGNTSVKSEGKQQVLNQGESTQSNKKKSLNAKSKEGIPTSPQAQGVSKPSSAKDDANPRILRSKDQKHFVDEHRTSLISRMTSVDPVLDGLLDKKILTQEQYDTVRKEKTDQDKMRKIYSYIKSWGNPEKNKFQCLLETHNSPLIKDLKKQIKKKK